MDPVIIPGRNEKYLLRSYEGTMNLKHDTAVAYLKIPP